MRISFLQTLGFLLDEEGKSMEMRIGQISRNILYL